MHSQCEASCCTEEITTTWQLPPFPSTRSKIRLCLHLCSLSSSRYNAGSVLSKISSSTCALHPTPVLLSRVCKFHSQVSTRSLFRALKRDLISLTWKKEFSSYILFPLANHLLAPFNDSMSHLHFFTLHLSFYFEIIRSWQKSISTVYTFFSWNI